MTHYSIATYYLWFTAVGHLLICGLMVSIALRVARKGPREYLPWLLPMVVGFAFWSVSIAYELFAVLLDSPMAVADFWRPIVLGSAGMLCLLFSFWRLWRFVTRKPPDALIFGGSNEGIWPPAPKVPGSTERCP